MALYSTLNQYMHFNVQKTITVKTSTVKMPSRVAFSNCTVTAKTHTHEQARNQLGTPGGGAEPSLITGLHMKLTKHVVGRHPSHHWQINGNVLPAPLL